VEREACDRVRNCLSRGVDSSTFDFSIVVLLTVVCSFSSVTVRCSNRASRVLVAMIENKVANLIATGKTED
jgi:hypothetical protein